MCLNIFKNDGAIYIHYKAIMRCSLKGKEAIIITMLLQLDLM